MSYSEYLLFEFELGVGDVICEISNSEATGYEY